MNFVHKLWRLAVAAMTDTSTPSPFPVSNSNTLDFHRLALFDAAHLQTFSLEGCQILRLDRSPHWALLFHFMCDGAHYGLIADRIPQPPPPSNTSLACLSSRDSSTLSSGAFEYKNVSDQVRGLSPRPNAPWPNNPPEGYSTVYSLDLPHPHSITLLDVSLVLMCTHQYKSSYRLVGYNCRWLAKTVALSLEQLARQHTKEQEWREHQALFFDKMRSFDLVKKQRVQKALGAIIPAYVEAVS